MNQTPRQQIEAAILRHGAAVKDMAKHSDYLTAGYAVDNAVDAILAVIKGLPAMQEEDDYTGQDYMEAQSRNFLRRQILAELEATKGISSHDRI